MSFRRRTRMISFRVSEHEFEQLRAMSESKGAGSVSDYARLSLCGDQQAVPETIAAKVLRFDGELRNLRAHLERLTALVESTHDAVVGAANDLHQR